MAKRDVDVADEGAPFGIEHGAFDGEAVDGVGAIEDDEGDMVLCGLFHGVEERGAIRVAAAADVLDVVDEEIESFEHLRCGPARLAMQTVNGYAARAFLIGYVFGRIGTPIDPVLGSKESGELDVIGVI